MNANFEPYHAVFLEALRVRHCSPSTISAYGRALHSFWRFAAKHGLEQVQDVTAVTVRAYQLDLEARGLKPWSRCAYTQALRRFFEHLEKPT